MVGVTEGTKEDLGKLAVFTWTGVQYPPGTPDPGPRAPWWPDDLMA